MKTGKPIDAEGRRSRPPNRRATRCGWPLAAILAALAPAATATDQGGHHWPVGATTGAPAGSEAGRGGLQLFADRQALLDAAAGLALTEEDFSGGFVPSTGVRVCFQALGHRSNDPCFRPGTLAPGFGIRGSRGSIFDANALDVDVVVLGRDLFDMPTEVVGNNLLDLPRNPTRIDFDPHPTVVGMDVYDATQGLEVRIEAYAEDDTLIGAFAVQPAALNIGAFAGFISDVPVRRVEVNAINDGSGEMIGRLLFGGGAGRLAAAQDRVDLGAVPQGGAAHAVARFSNAGHLPLPVALQLPPAPFALLDDDCSGGTLAAGDSCDVLVMLDSDARGVHVDHWQPAPGVSVELAAQVLPSRLVTAPGHLDFGAVSSGATSATQTVVVRNATAVAIQTGLSVAVPAPFVRTGGSCPSAGIDLAPGEACTLDIAFNPLVAGEFDADLALFHADGQGDGITLAGRATQGGAP
ncbi:choice-of-anchor D domain-containing protein [Pseudofulvimonas gallinarii]|uniref:Choice-of-anchor D domain-containing protein n=1 Tax=Pseudofulvimonas gallinarii TaxID=634155 RepID=A0A4R3LK28_9GAMM|nr:choice-of-anchor D domain-containing protein [Pseudofulvimonas gallinarii]TCS98894.1 hypothetical protein EDC25_10791 [Pseudofulvimonas gallinarii]